MLHTDTIFPGTLELLNGVMKIPEFDSYLLAGGTALALQIGHRISVDLDFFGEKEIDAEEFVDLLRSIGTVRIMSRSKNILILDINGIKVDFVNYRYPMIKVPIQEGSIRLTNLEDIGAMKLAAITGRGRKRDFVDLHFLLNHFSLEALMEFYRTKYPDGSEFLVIRSLTYFADADQDEDPRMLIPVKWEAVKSSIIHEVRKF
jgi:predicted nucleotidyltransferase component of viral defense system